MSDEPLPEPEPKPAKEKPQKSRCAHCKKPITLTRTRVGTMWLHAHDRYTGLCHPDSLESTTHAEPE